ncbi:MAG: signal peptide peptidase SppA, partial [Myxococcales bacterium]|nr:signal peptide peptidase SppA [Myxococcales bacterium]
VEALAAGDYKSAMEPFTRTGPSGPNREAIEALLADLDGAVVTDLAAARGVDAQVIRDAFAAAPLAAPEALAMGLLDRLAAEDEVFDPEADGRTVDAADYAGRPSPWPRIRFRQPRLAVVDLRGTIKDGRALDPAPTGAVPRALAGALAKARRSKRIKGVLLAIDSPGGSATASEAMWRAVRRLAAKKPVIAVMGDVAASGGYYVAAACDGIVAAPTTLTGSIGVIAARPTAQGLLTRLGLFQHTLGPGPRAHLLHPGKRLSQGEREALQRTVDDFYQVFLARVAEGRDRTPAEVDPVAQGRVWSGQAALAHGLVDRLGDERDGLAWLAERVGLAEVPDRVAYITPPRNLRAVVRGLLSARMAPLPAAVQEPLALWQQVAEQPYQAWCPWRVD